MSRLMSVAMTVDAVRERRKTVTRRKGWWLDKNGRRILKPGDRLTLCEKVQGRKPGEPLVRLAEVEVVDVRREELSAVAGPYATGVDGRTTWPEVEAEGFPGMHPTEFMQRFFDPQGIGVMDEVTRIKWSYLDYAAPTRGRVWTDDVRVDGGRALWVKRCCNGCGRELGDATEAELDAAVSGLPLPDVTDECGCARYPTPEETP